jgi:meiotic recombination protein SPO11
MLERIVDALLEGNERLTFTLKSRAGISRKQQSPKEDVSEAPVPRERDISFPGNTVQEAWNFS